MKAPSLLICTLVLCPVAVVAGVSPAAAQPAPSGRWEIAFHAGGRLPTNPTAGTVSLPGPGQVFTTASGLMVHLRIDQTGGLSMTDLRQAIEQVRKIWSAVGVAVTTGRYGELANPGAATISIRLVGASPRIANHFTALAWVIPGETGAIPPAMFVSVSGIVQLLSAADFRGRPLCQRPQAIRDRVIAQAIGRAIGHEIGHFVHQSAHHTPRGLMRPRYSTADLIGESLEPFGVPYAERPIARREIARLAEVQSRALIRVPDPEAPSSAADAITQENSDLAMGVEESGHPLRRSSTSCAATASKSARNRARGTLRGCRRACRSGRASAGTD